MINVKGSNLEGVLEFNPQPFIDHRGIYVELFNHSFYEKHIDQKFIQDDISKSRQNVLRGLHGDNETWKLISCIHGEIYFVVLDLRDNSKTKGIWQSFVIGERNYKQILVPPGCANGHLVLSENAIFHYKQTTYYSKDQFTILWDDPKYSIWWPIKTPILSRRDELGHYI